MNNDTFSRITDAVNGIGDHVWAMVLVGLGATLVWCGHHDIGQMVIGGGLTAFRSQGGQK